jgi:hypothetical protein
MQAQMIDAIRALQYILIMVNRDPDKRPPEPPAPYPIPDMTLRKKKTEDAPPGSFAFIAKRHIAQARKQREAGSQCPKELEAKK